MSVPRNLNQVKIISDPVPGIHQKTVNAWLTQHPLINIINIQTFPYDDFKTIVTVITYKGGS